MVNVLYYNHLTIGGIKKAVVKKNNVDDNDDLMEELPDESVKK